jgi:5'-nucleotidase (lipoprotein e(P4) family)
MKHVTSLFVFALLAACTSIPQAANSKQSDPPPQTVQVSIHEDGPPLALHWFRNSAERRGLYSQIYLMATDSVRGLANGHADNTWGVILDIDETILDNSEYQARLVTSKTEYSDATWSAWVSDKRAMALPGTAAFLHTVRSELHGRVVLVTNRTQNDCADTELNLHAQALEYDAILCAQLGPGGKWINDKNPRFESVQRGDVKILGPIQVLAYFGDNIQDFPASSQQHPAATERFGKDLFLLPNPVYGSWVSNIYR